MVSWALQRLQLDLLHVVGVWFAKLCVVWAVPENVLDGFSLSAFGAEVRIDLPTCIAPVSRPKVAANDALENSVSKGVVPK